METIKDQNDLLWHIKETIGKSKVLKLTDILYNRMFDIKDLMSLTFLPDREIAFRAAWILENLVLTNPERFINDFDALLKNFYQVNNRSCQRHYSKILMNITGLKMTKAVRQKIEQTNMEPVAGHCFDLIIDAKTPIAVKVFCCQILFNLRLRYPWISELLADQLKILMHKEGKPAIQSKGQKLLSFLIGEGV